MKNRSRLFNMMYDCSAKFIKIIFNMLSSKGPILLYSNFITMEGL